MRQPESPLFGLIWYQQPEDIHIQNLPLRHWCDQGDGLKFMWQDADGKSFGHQIIQDNRLTFHTDWINHRRSWMSRINILDLPIKNAQENPSQYKKYGFIFYLALQDTNSTLRPIFKNGQNVIDAFKGSMNEIGPFKLSFKVSSSKSPEMSYLLFRHHPFMDMTFVNQLITGSLGRKGDNGNLFLIGSHRDRPDDIERPNFVAVQFTIEAKSTIEVKFDAVEKKDSIITSFQEHFDKQRSQFRARFEEIFELESNNYPDYYKDMGRSALSNMLGSIGYWSGYSKVKGKGLSSGQIAPYGPLNLLSAVPSRSFFPRGFLWDEGFHNLLIRQYDPNLSLDIISSWLDTMNFEGWIPREMVLDNEAEAKIPPEYVVQSDSIANPPMIFYLIDQFMHDSNFMVHHQTRLRKLYPRLKLWYLWIRKSQKGPKHGTFQWQGRNSTTNLELNPKTLPSGLDDFPRATHPNSEEYHLDLRCWMAVASRVLRNLCENSEDNQFINEIEEDMRIFNDFELLNKLHWSESKKAYFDYGLHSDKVRLMPKRKVVKQHPNAPPVEEVVYLREVINPPKLRLVEDVFGYANLFPFLLKLLPANSDKLGEILSRLNDTNELWTPYGLRSLSKHSPYYMKRNTEHDAPYWRGYIWINMNYLALSALRYYASASGHYQNLAEQLRIELRNNLVTNIANQYNKTGTFWENYDDSTGEGRGCRPFTGWTALVLAIMSDKYD
uniref:Mannosyl-oligosaccharide glucosidase n=1 Tax=Acrobeloides nanus TaxID=290746 RepID=A0A914C5J0_9BILA